MALQDPNAMATRASPFFRLRCWWHWNIVRRIPRLVWPGDEVDVLVTFKEAKLPEFTFDPSRPKTLSHALAYLGDGRMAKIESGLSEIGIDFDKGGGAAGRDWEWDFSLRGPVSVTFKRRAQRPERRL